MIQQLGSNVDDLLPSSSFAGGGASHHHASPNTNTDALLAAALQQVEQLKHAAAQATTTKLVPTQRKHTYCYHHGSDRGHNGPQCNYMAKPGNVNRHKVTFTAAMIAATCKTDAPGGAN
jgi:DnaJ-class molecular chaperone